jgi:putative methionine-R-sulfoxide reductase with GAF domain
MELNSICHMHCIAGIVITFVLLLNWVGIYLYLVNANKILTNFKSNAQRQPSSLVSLTLHVSSHLWRVHTHYSPQLVEL